MPTKPKSDPKPAGKPSRSFLITVPPEIGADGELLTSANLEDLFGASSEVVARCLEAGEIPFERFGRVRLIRRSDLRKAIAERLAPLVKQYEAELREAGAL
jgi:excisionase family DNA binding protein